MIKRKIFLTSSILLISSSLLFTAGTPVFANENTEVTLSQPINENITEQELTEGFNQLASLTIDDLITMLKQHGVDPSTVFTAQEIASARSQEMLRAGRNTVLNVNNETKDVYINFLYSYYSKNTWVCSPLCRTRLASTSCDRFNCSEYQYE
ncbi:hypothetical protein [Enterococcus sp. DIV0660C]|uniref:hypothetical protein n=1 Tax=Enterococcus sp. DIV0660C TaxID=2230880 RepID=UPI001A8DE90C|nr:hypothetical protein [Enterococcus sp. DIV0660C]MBO0430756.1 hypothetical protein [Enterococcus sp. DIV0660C]